MVEALLGFRGWRKIIISTAYLEIAQWYGFRTWVEHMAALKGFEMRFILAAEGRGLTGSPQLVPSWEAFPPAR